MNENADLQLLWLQKVYKRKHIEVIIFLYHCQVSITGCPRGHKNTIYIGSPLVNAVLFIIL